MGGVATEEKQNDEIVEATSNLKNGNEKSEALQELEANLESSVDAILKETQDIDAETKSSDKEELSDEDLSDNDDSEDDISEDEDGDGDKSKDDKSDRDDAPISDELSDDLLTRAVKAGLSIKEARKFSSSETLEMVCERLELLNHEESNDEDDEYSEENISDEDPLASIKDLDPDEYDESVVNNFKALKQIIRKQSETINALVSANKGDRSWFDSKVSGLDDSVLKELEKSPEKRDALKEQYDILIAGHESSGKVVDRDRIFEAAVAIELGDIKTKVTRQKKSDKMKNREEKFLARPGGANTKPKGDLFQDTAAMIEQRFNM